MSETESFWRGKFGDNYTERNQRAAMVGCNTVFFARALSMAQRVESILELGCGTGQNLEALRLLYPDRGRNHHLVKLAGIEINASAVADAGRHGDIILGSIFDDITVASSTLVITKGVLIHIHPSDLGRVYQRIYDWSRRYILLAEYYSPKPTMIPYRGHDNKLWKRDFAGDMLDAFPDLKLVDYGFQYHLDPTHPQDDLNWFLLEKAR